MRALECGHVIPARGARKRAERRRIEPDPNDPNYCYHKGKELFRCGQSGEEWFRKAVALDPANYWAYYFWGRELLQNGNLKEAAEKLKNALAGLATKPWPHYYLGKILLKQADFTGAEREFKEALASYPNLETAKRYLDEIKWRKKNVGFPQTVEEVEQLTDNIVLMNHALLEWFETSMRYLVETILERAYGAEWWRRGVPLPVRKSCAERREESPDEEFDSPELSFMQFYGYAEILKANKELFNPYFEVKDWVHRLNHLEPIRNGVMHCRGRHLSLERNATLKSWCHELEGILKAVNKPLNE